jgi:hypothetical protein
MSQQIAGDFSSQSKREIPKAIHALLSDLAVIRNTILINAPACLPQIAPAFIDAEEQINCLWRS